MADSKKPNILIVDDIPQNIEYIEAILRSLPVHFIKVGSGQEALEKICDHELALALIDIHMPGMSGIELAKTILSDTQRGIFPIIFVTSYTADESNIEMFYQSGIIDYIQKPFPRSVLINKIKVYLELYRQKERLANSEKMYRMLLTLSPEGIVIMNMDGTIREASIIALQVLGIDQAEKLSGTSFLDFLPDNEQEHFTELLKKTRQEELSQNMEFRVIRASGAQFISEISTTFIMDSGGNPSALMAIIRDISQRRVAEQQKIQTERMASLGEMATGIAHEINQPLNTISLGLDNLLSEIARHPDMDSAYFNDKSKKVFDSVERISYIIDHIRTFSRGQDDLIRISFHINDSIRNGVSMISEQFRQKGIRLELLLDDHIDSLVGNTYQFEQVILNLLSNARDAIDEKRKIFGEDFTKEIRIRSYQQERTIYAEVTDTGIGMTPESMYLVMFPFYTTKGSGKGTGLGLSISLGIIKELNGTIEVDSQYAQGTTIRIVVPVDQK